MEFTDRWEVNRDDLKGASLTVDLHGTQISWLAKIDVCALIMLNEAPSKMTYMMLFFRDDIYSD